MGFFTFQSYPTMTRYFINQEGDANKFWTVQVSGCACVVTFGKIGTKGREARKELTDTVACATEAARLIREKQRKGYREVLENEPVPEKLKPEYRPMDEELFWEILDSLNWKRTGDDEAVLRPAEKRLAALPVEDIFAFEEILAEKLYQLDGEKYAVACYPGKDPDSISGDGFLYDRCSVLTNGREFYEQVVQHPETWPVGFEFESLLFLVHHAYARKTGSEDYPHITRLCFETGSNAAGWPAVK